MVHAGREREEAARGVEGAEGDLTSLQVAKMAGKSCYGEEEQDIEGREKERLQWI